MAPDFNLDLEQLAQGKELQEGRWSGLLEHILSRVEEISLHDFPTPRIPLPDSSSLAVKEELASGRDSPQSQEPPEKRVKTEASNESTLGAHASPANESTGLAANAGSSSSGTLATESALPPQLYTLIRTIQATLQDTFATAPPHTSQRLAELILYPRKHYRSLPSYLRALDRIVTVASPNSVFPLPSTNTATIESNLLFNGTSSPSKDQNDKDFIGGAELTPIPWLRDSNPTSPTLHPKNAENLHTESTSLIDGPNGAGSIETVTVSVNGISSATPSQAAPEEQAVHGITQGELIRQEQEAGVAPVPTVRASRNAAMRDQGTGTGDDTEMQDSGEDEVVHARGPSVIGMEDMGPQAQGSGLEEGIDIEGPLRNAKPADEAANPASSNESGGNPDKTEDAGTVIANADGVAEGASEGDVGLEKGADAADTTAR